MGEPAWPDQTADGRDSRLLKLSLRSCFAAEGPNSTRQYPSSAIVAAACAHLLKQSRWEPPRGPARLHSPGAATRRG